MDKEKLTDYFKNMTPTDSQKKRMKKAIMSHGEHKGSRTKSPRDLRFSRIAKVAASVVLALIILGNLPLVGKAGAGIINWFQNHMEILLDGLESQEHQLINSNFSIEKHEKYAERLQYRFGLSKERAEEEAFLGQLYEVAIINRAIELGIDVSKEEAFQEAQEVNEGWEELLEDENTTMDIDALHRIKNEYEELGIYEDEFWNEQRLSSYAFSVMLKKLMEYELKENPTKNWDELHKEIVTDFISNETQQINEFKKEIGMN